jgi:hypothetical protein
VPQCPLSIGENRTSLAIFVLELFNLQPPIFYFEMDSSDSSSFTNVMNLQQCALKCFSSNNNCTIATYYEVNQICIIMYNISINMSYIVPRTCSQIIYLVIPPVVISKMHGCQKNSSFL